MTKRKGWSSDQVKRDKMTLAAGQALASVLSATADTLTVNPAVHTVAALTLAVKTARGRHSKIGEDQEEVRRVLHELLDDVIDLVYFQQH